MADDKQAGVTIYELTASERKTMHKLLSLGLVAHSGFKLYIWRGIRHDYTEGIGFAVGRTKAEAIEAIHAISEPWEWNSYAGELLTVEPEVHDFPYGGWISGGG